MRAADRSGDARARRGAGWMTGSLRRKAPPPSACSPSRRGPRWCARRSSRPAPPRTVAGSRRAARRCGARGARDTPQHRVGQRAEVAEDHRAHDPHTDAPETSRGARASGEAVPCGGAGFAKDQVAVVRGAAARAAYFAGAFCGAALSAGVSFKLKPRRMLSRFAFPRSAVKEFKRPSKVVEDAGHFKS